MTIWTRHGLRVTVFANCGEVTPPGFRETAEDIKLHLLLVEMADPIKPELLIERYRFAEHLKADGGWQEIEQAMMRAPRAVLTPKQLEKAIKEAL